MYRFFIVTLTVLIAAAAVPPDAAYGQAEEEAVEGDSWVVGKFMMGGKLLEETWDMEGILIPNTSQKLATGEGLEYEVSLPQGESLLAALCESACGEVELTVVSAVTGTILEHDKDVDEDVRAVRVSNNDDQPYRVTASVRVKDCSAEQCWVLFGAFTENASEAGASFLGHTVGDR